MGVLVDRRDDDRRGRDALRRSPVLLITGPRQVGKTTLAHRLVEGEEPVHIFDADDPRDLARLADPILALESLTGIVVIDEAQRLDHLFPVLRVLADRPGLPARFVILGSASPDLVGLAAESLAGRVEMLELGGFRFSDVSSPSGRADLDRWWRRGGLPLSYLAGSEEDSVVWRDNYISTFLERDLAEIGVRVPATTMRRFWTMLAHHHAQTWNGAELSRALGVAQSTVRRHLDSLTDALVVRQLQPWFVNSAKRQVRSPKVYLRDTGLLHRLLGLRSQDDLLGHPKVGASFEGLIVEEVARTVAPAPVHFWRTQQGAELDLLVELDGIRVGIEVKRTSSPSITRSMRISLADLELDVLLVVHAGRDAFLLADRILAVPAERLLMATDVDSFLAVAGHRP